MTGLVGVATTGRAGTVAWSERMDGSRGMWRRAAACVLCVAAVLAGVAQAQTSTSFQVSATVAPGCAVDGVGTSGSAGNIGTLDFGRGSALIGSTRSTSLATRPGVVLRCTPGSSLRMSLDGGQHVAGGVRQLQRVGGTQRLPYQLFRDAGLTQPIGIGVAQAITVNVANTNDVRLPLYARVSLPGMASGLPAGQYTDVLLVTLTW